MAVSPPTSRPTDHTPASAKRPSALGSPGTRVIRRCSMAPAADLVAAAVTPAARWRGSTTPVTPAHSADRRMAPKLPGSVTPSSSSRNGSRPEASGWSRSSSSCSMRGWARASTPWGASVRATDSNLDRDTSRMVTLASSARSMMSSRIGAGSRSPAIRTSRVRRVPASNSSRTACRPSTWSPPRPFGGPFGWFPIGVLPRWPRPRGPGRPVGPRRGGPDRPPLRPPPSVDRADRPSPRLGPRAPLTRAPRAGSAGPRQSRPHPPPDRWRPGPRLASP